LAALGGGITIAEVAETGLYGVYHVTNSGSCSWHEFAREMFGVAGVEARIVPLPAARPANEVLSTSGSPQPRHWREALADYLERES
jgi:dTDP-4-dehydrorhamnose reductase